jgi:hypothetical protein
VAAFFCRPACDHLERNPLKLFADPLLPGLFFVHAEAAVSQVFLIIRKPFWRPTQFRHALKDPSSRHQAIERPSLFFPRITENRSGDVPQRLQGGVEGRSIRQPKT